MADWLTLSGPEIEAHLHRAPGVILPVGSVEQHGPIGLAGTDALCAEAIAREAGARADALVLPVLAYAPAQFNMAFAGTISISVRSMAALLDDIFESLHRQGVRAIYCLNGHGANQAAVNSAMHDFYARTGDEAPAIRLRNWWDFTGVNDIRDTEFGEWEGLHATPSEIAITQHCHRIVEGPAPPRPDTPLSPAFMAERTGDRHPPAGLHRAEFPDGRVGADSGLASPVTGARLFDAAATAVAEDFAAFLQSARV